MAETSMLLNTLAVIGLAIVVLYQGRIIQSQTVMVDSMGEALGALLDFVSTVVKKSEEAAAKGSE